jgi:mono/diheme cytochrome c family protein
MKYFFLAFVAVVLLVVMLAGVRGRHSPNRPLEFFPDMVRQMKVKPQSPSGFFADGIGPRRPVEGTVPMGYEIPPAPVPMTTVANAEQTQIVQNPTYGFTEAPDYYNTGKMGDKWGTGIPLQVTPELLAKGQERFNINCAVCHGATGGGNGVTSKYGLNGIANYHDDKYLKMPDGQIFNTITNGYQSMMGYGANIAIRDRWAVVCYVRALQKSQMVKLEELPADQAQKIRDSK